WSPLILGLPTVIQDASGVPPPLLLRHWLGVTALLFAISGAVLTARLASTRRGVA
ncbi:MAG: hypothetical protein QOG46_1843, partial [Pseudonocardiales bacterium]|nr:hypothetical protein [Pseudonocardiales bacterium]